MAAPARAEAIGSNSAGAVPLAMLPGVVTPLHYRLNFTIDPAKDGFSGHTEIDVNVAKPLKSFFLHGLDLRVAHAAIRLASDKTVPATYAQVHESGVAVLKFAQQIPAGRATLLFDYHAPFNGSLEGLYKVVDGGNAYAFTQFEAIDARRAFPSFDEPGFKTPFDIAVTAPAGDKVVGNTPERASGAAVGGMQRWVFQPTKPLPTYLVALAVGPLDIVDGGDIPANKFRAYPLHLRGITAKGNGARLKYALSLTPATVEALETYYGIAYPYQKLDILAVPDFAAGAMENAGAITFREQLLLMDDNAPLEQKRSSLTVQAHELAHQWFGDLVTPKWWDDIWLNESFATWMEYKIAQMVRPEQDYSRETLRSALNVMRLDELPSARHIHNPVHGPDDIDNAFDDITYSKGGAVLSMFESYVGREQFRQGIHAYLTKFAFRNASAQDFIGTIAASTHHPEIVKAFNGFIDQPHIPLLETEVHCAAKTASARVSQSTYMPVGIRLPQGHWQVPMCLSADGGASVCRLVEASQTVALGSTCPSVVVPNVDGAGYYRFTLDEPHWQGLISGAATLSPADQLTLFHNLNAALRAGKASAADFFAVTKALAPAAQWDLLNSNHGGSMNLKDAFHDLRITGVLAPAQIPALQVLIRETFGPRLTELGLAPKPGEAVPTALLRQALVELLVEEGRDPQLIAQLTKAAHAFVDSGGKDHGGLPPELIQESLRAGVLGEGAAFGDALVAAIAKTHDEYFAQIAIYAVAGSEDRATLDQLLALALTPAIRTGDLRYVLRYYAGEPMGRVALWSWATANFDALKKRLSSRGMSGLPDIQRNACDPETKAALHAFVAPKVKELEGVGRVLSEDEERIDRCIAFKAAKGAEINAALASVR
jgi:alanyl aminopeptidase